MKLTNNEIGQKFRLYDWKANSYFKLLAISTSGEFLGEDEDGNGFVASDDAWLPHISQPKQEVLMSPSIVSSLRENPPEGLFSSALVKQIINERSLGHLQSEKPLRVVLKNCKAITNYSEGRLVDRADIEADLWIKIKEE